MSYLVMLFGVVLVAAVGVFFSEQINPPRDVTNLPAGVFLAGLLVRIALTIVCFSITALVLGSIWA